MRILMRHLSALLLTVGAALILGGCAVAAPLVNGAN